MQNINHPFGSTKVFIKNFCKSFLEKIISFFANIFFDLKKNEKIIISPAIYQKWNENNDFNEAYEKYKNFTMLDKHRAFTVWSIVKNLNNLEGEIIEIGCFKGGTGFLLSNADNQSQIKLYDTFEGFPITEENIKKNTLKANFEESKEFLNKFEISNIEFFKKRFPIGVDNINKIKFCHIDINTYSETKNSFNFIVPLLVKGGVVVFDDYGIWRIDGVKKFISEIEENLKDQFYFFFNYMGQCILIKK